MHMLILLLSVAAGAAIVLVTHILNKRRSTPETDYEQIIAEFIRVILPMEADCALFEKALADCGAYADGRLTHSEIVESLENAIHKLEKIRNGIEPPASADAGTVALMESAGIIPEEFAAFTASRKPSAEAYISDLKIMHQLALNAGMGETWHNDFCLRYNIHQKIHEAMKGYNFYGCVNYWFAPWNEAATALVKEHIVSRLSSYIITDYTWQTKREDAEQMAMKYLDLVEEYTLIISKLLAESEALLLEMKDILKNED